MSNGNEKTNRRALSGRGMGRYEYFGLGVLYSNHVNIVIPVPQKMYWLIEFFRPKRDLYVSKDAVNYYGHRCDSSVAVCHLF